MRFEKQAVDADGRGRPGQRFDHCPVAAGGVAQSARFLHAVGGVEDDGGAQGLHCGMARMSLTSRP